MRFYDVFKSDIEEFRKSWVWFLVIGILLVALGVVCIVKAQTATKFSILALGWILVVSAVFWFVGSFRAVSWPMFFLYLLDALLRGAIGYLLIRHPDAGAESVTMVLAALFIIGGLYRTVAAAVIRFPYWGFTVLAGIVSVCLGVYLMANYPLTGTYFVGIVVGVDLIFDGGSLVAFAGGVRSLVDA